MKIINKLISKIYYFIKNPSYYFFIIWNRVKFYIKGIEFGENLKVFNTIYIRKHKDSKIIVGDNFVFSSGNCYNPLCRNLKGCIHTSKKAKITIGNNVGISSAVIWCSDEINIGDNTLIGGDCILLDTDAHSLDFEMRKEKKIVRDGLTLDSILAKKAPIVIENDVLIGTRCIILKGVTIGARSVIAAGSVVSKSIPNDCIAGGNPCKIIKTKQ